MLARGKPFSIVLDDSSVEREDGTAQATTLSVRSPDPKESNELFPLNSKELIKSSTVFIFISKYPKVYR